MRYRLIPYKSNIALQKGFVAWRLLKQKIQGIWDVVISMKNTHIKDPNERNKLDNLPPSYYIVEATKDVMEKVTPYFKNIKNIDKQTSQITFEAD